MARLSVTQLEILPQPPVKENKMLVWPDWPLKLRTSSSQQEGCERDWSVQTRRAIGERRTRSRRWNACGSNGSWAMAAR